MPAAAIVGAAAIGAVGANKAAKAQTKGANAASAAQMYAVDKSVEQQAPFRNAGINALNLQQILLGMDPTNGAGPQQSYETYQDVAKRLKPQFTGVNGDEDGVRQQAWDEAAQREFDRIEQAREFWERGGTNNPLFGRATREFTGDNLVNEPGYQFGLQQGQRGLEGSALARGGLYSGAAGRALSRFNQDYAGTKFGEAFNRDAVFKNQLLNPLQALTSGGQSATNQVQSAQMGGAANVGQNMIGAGNARASSYLAGANALSTGLSGGLYAWNQGRGGGSNPMQTWGLGGGQFGGSDNFYG